MHTKETNQEEIDDKQSPGEEATPGEDEMNYLCSVYQRKAQWPDDQEQDTHKEGTEQYTRLPSMKPAIPNQYSPHLAIPPFAKTQTYRT